MFQLKVKKMYCGGQRITKFFKVHRLEPSQIREPDGFYPVSVDTSQNEVLGF